MTLNFIGMQHYKSGMEKLTSLIYLIHRVKTDKIVFVITLSNFY